MSHTCHSPVFPSVTRLLAGSESIAEVPQRQVAKHYKRKEVLLDPGYCTHTIVFSNKSNCSAVILKRSRQVLVATHRSVPFRSA